MGHRDAEAVERTVELQHGSPTDRRFAEKSVEDRQADLAVEERLGGKDPGRLLEDDEPPQD